MGSTSDFGVAGACSDSERAPSISISANAHRQQAIDTVVVRENGRGVIPLSYAQERLWFLYQLGLIGAAYNMRMALRLTGALNEGVLERSLFELVRRHESLRTHFGVRDGVPHQLIEPPGLFELHRADLSHVVDPKQREYQLREWMRREQLYRFDLCKGPLLRVVLVRLSAKEHALFLTIHHIVCDGWSLGVLRRELSALYAAYSQDQPSPLPELAVQYADYAIWQRQSLKGDVLQRQLQYWRGRLTGASPQLELPTDRSRPAVESFKGAETRFELPRTLLEALKEIARHEGATLFMVVLAAYQILLSRWSGQQDVVVGSPIAGRGKGRIEGLIGFFVNMLVLRTDVSADLTFRMLLRRVKEETIEAYAHQDLPFDALVKELCPDRNLSRQPIFQVMLALRNYPEGRLELPGLALTWTEDERVTARCDLTLYLYETPSGLSGTFEYATDIFDDRTIERMAGHLRVMFDGIVANPNCSIRQLPMQTAVERKRVLYSFNDTASAYPHERLIHELFEERVERSPDAVAVVCEHLVLTYSELNAKADQLARYLSEEGVQVGEYVPILMPRCLQMLIAELGVLKSGGAYVPLDSSMPLERQMFIVRDCGARRILADCAIYEGFEQEPIQWIDCSKVSGASKSLLSGKQKPHVASTSPAYVMYTSGSTGVPKGVVVPHRAVNRLVINNAYARIESTDCIAHCSNPAFDASTFEVWAGLLNGARVVIVPQSVLLEAKCFAESLVEHRVTVLWLTVGLFVQYEEALAPVMGQLRYLLTGGDIVDPGTIRRVLHNNPPRHLLNAYGPTECTTFSTTYRIERLDEDAERVPIGRPISNARIYILDDRLQPTPIGVPGEIYVAGAGLALGYLNRPALTAERLIADPFSSDVSARIYRSGDVGRWREDGTILFLGRNDYQVKLRGFRVELGEIEAQLGRHGQVGEAVVTAREYDGGKRLVAYVTRRSEGKLTAEQLRTHLLAVLPEYMVPSAFVILDTFPLTPNGKLDRRALPPPELGAFVSSEYAAPEGELEESLARIWQELLRVERVGRHDNFFQLGGHSLLVLKALFTINQSLNCALSVRDVYQCPRLQDLAKRICEGSAPAELVDLTREAVLDDAIVPNPGVRRVPPEAVMLTGCSGFVGRFLLARLLEDTNAKVYCLVRASSASKALSRLRSIMVKWDLWRDEFDSRVIAIPSDLRLPRLGIDDSTYQTLSERIDSIYHCATSMNHLEAYAAAKPANVESARELLKLATDRKPKLINCISTLSIFSQFTVDTERFVDETSSIDHEIHSTSRGYSASKWVAEKIFITAGSRGIPCNIFRLGLVWADTQRGRYDELQREYMLFKSCLISGLGIENYKYNMVPTPVDYVVRAVVSLANRHTDGKGVFHISSSNQMVDGLFERCNKILNNSLKLISHYDWICEVKRLHNHGKSLPIVPLVEFAFTMDEESFCEYQRRHRSASVRVSCARTHRELEQAGIVAPEFNDDLLKIFINSIALKGGGLHEVVDCRSDRMITQE